MTDQRNKYGLKTFSRTKEEFVSFYEKELKDFMMELEVERNTYWKTIRNQLILVFLGLVILLPVFFFFDQGDTFLKGIIYFNLCAFSLGYIALTYTNRTKELDGKVKDQVVPQLVEFMNPNFSYEAEKFMDKVDFDRTLIFRNKTDGFLGDDLISGFVYDEEEEAQTKVSFSEIAAMNIHKSVNIKGEKVKPAGVYVNGLFFKAEFNKDFGKSITIIKPRWLLGKRKYQKKLARYGKGTPLEEVHLENDEFMEEFITHSNDQVQARVILQSDTMQNLLDYVHYRAETITGEKAKKRKKKFFIPYFTFRDHHIYLVLHTRKNHFNILLHKKITIDTTYDYFKDINRSLRLIDDLNLNLDLYKKTS